MTRVYTGGVRSDIDSVLIDRERIAERVREMGAEIRRDLESLGDDAEIVLVPILTGSVIFVADLMRELPMKIRISVVTVSSYPGKSMKSRGSEIAGELPPDLEGRHVLIIDDILDSRGVHQVVLVEFEIDEFRTGVPRDQLPWHEVCMVFGDGDHDPVAF